MLIISDGKLGEEASCLFLRKIGYEILDRNWHCRFGEIDIISSKDGSVVFFEVKTRSSNRWGGFKDYVGTKKLKKLCKCIKLYLFLNYAEEKAWRLDGILAIKYKAHLHLCHLQSILEGLNPDKFC